MTKARKEHRCCLCFEIIPLNSDYVSRRITPWDSGGDVFWTYRAHPECDKIWQTIGGEFEWLCQPDAAEWRDMQAYYEAEQQRKALVASLLAARGEVGV